MRRNEREREHTPGGTELCKECADKLRAHYTVVDRPESAAVKSCSICWRCCPVTFCEIAPLRRTFTRRTGGGERQRAGR